MHRTLERQLRRLRLGPERPPASESEWTDFLQGVDRAYREADELVYLVTNSERVVTDELERSQRELALAQRLAGLGSWSFDAVTGKGTISDELAHILELDVGHRRLSMDGLVDFVAPADRLQMQQILQGARVAPRGNSVEIRFVTRTGRERWCLCRIASQLEGDGRVAKVDGTILDISDRRAAEEQALQMARTDALTGLANRAHFFHLLRCAIEVAKANLTGVAVIFVDLDGFKTVNDTCGHHAGDNLLGSVAKRLENCLRSSDAIGRFGGDEFVILLQGLSTPEEVSVVTDKVLSACATTVSANDESISVSASVGVALYPGDGSDAEHLLRSADAAMYVAKDSGRNNVRFFASEVRGPRHVGRSMHLALRSAVERHQIRVAYQPIVDGRSREILGFEALSRWDHPEHGPIPPTEFIALAEETGLIGALGQGVTRSACQEIMALSAALRRDHWISINVSPMQLRSTDFIEHCKDLFSSTGIDTSLLRLEITEDAVIYDLELAIDMLSQFKALGVGIWLDDFGTGHLSLAYLQRLPIDCVKVDRTFMSEIRGTHTGPLLQGIITMARAVGCEVLAEGVETEEQREALLKAGCTLMQGYLFGRPDRLDRWKRGASFG